MTPPLGGLATVLYPGPPDMKSLAALLPSILVVAFTTATAVATATGMQRATPYPELAPEKRVYTAGVDESFDSLRPLIRELEETSPETYYVVVVESSGSGDQATRRYVDELHARWRKAASRDDSLELDPDRAILVLLAITNRQLSIHAGVALQSKLGLRGDTIDRDIVGPHFIPYARSGEYAAGLAALLPEIDRWIREKEAAKAATARKADERDERRKRFRSTTLPLIVAGGGLALVLAFLALLSLRFARAGRSARARLEAFRTEVVQFLDKLDALKQRQELLPFTDQDYGGSMTGETLDFFEKIETTREALRDEWLVHMDTCREVERMLGEAKWPRTARYREALDRMSAKGSGLDATHEGYERAVERLDRLERAHEETTTVLAEYEERLARLTSQLESIGELGLSTTPYEVGTEACRAALESARGSKTPDPLGALQILADAGEHLTELGRWTERVISIVAAIDDVQDEVKRTREKIGKLRSEGWKLDEEGGNPDPPLARAGERAGAARLALDRGEDEAADEEVQHAAADVERARRIITRQQEARERCATGIPNAREEIAALRGRLPGARADREELERDFADSSWAGVADHVDRTEAILTEIEPILEDADSSSAESVQRYFHAVDRLGHVERRQAEASERLDDLTTRTDELRALREAARKQESELASRRKEAERSLTEHSAVVGPDVAELMASTDALARDLADRIVEPRPDWVRLHEEVAAAEEGYRSVVSEAEEDARLHRALEERLREADRRAGEVERQLASSSADRMPANHRFQEARDVLQKVRARSAVAGSDWGVLLERLADSVRELDAASRLATTDLKLARQIEEAIGDAEHEIRKAASYSRMGSTADVAGARAELGNARDRYSAQDYETALRLAASARRAATDAYDDAVLEARRRVRRRERERRQQEAQARAAAAVVRAALSAGRRRRSTTSRSRSSGSGFSFGSRPSKSWSRPSSSSSSSSWSSGSSQSSW